MYDLNKPNRLINEASPYLLQHAYNPVNWYPWGDEAWQRARAENKPVIISIGYSACHWCHVMEHESFEDIDVAAVMNDFFISIKVDREERPDVDNVYMEAVQLMTGRGGWPLNCIVMPDGRPIYGGTYFPRNAWLNVLSQINNIFTNENDKVESYAKNLMEGLLESEKIKFQVSINEELNIDISKIVSSLKLQFDFENGGNNRAPKFPMPTFWQFLLNQAVVSNSDELKNHVKLTLDKMAQGGIYDQLGGGFARYSVDEKWKVPHFEKMLYDNGQLISLYAQAFSVFNENDFANVVIETIAFCDSELLNKNHVYNSAIDADSEGVEGKFYVWKKDELRTLLTQIEYDFVCDYWNVNEFGYWEHDNFIFIRSLSDREYVKKNKIEEMDFLALKEKIKQKLWIARSLRVRPGVDDKCLLGWNAILLKGICEAAKYVDCKFSLKAQSLYESIKTNFYIDGKWYRSIAKNSIGVISFAEDLSLLCEAILSLYEVDFNKSRIFDAIEIIELLINDYYNPETGFFYYCSKSSEKLIINRTEIFDNVIASPNSILCECIYRLGVLTNNSNYTFISLRMLKLACGFFENAPGSMGNWLNVFKTIVQTDRQIIAIGPNFLNAISLIRKKYIANTIFCAAKIESDLPMLEGKLISGKTMIYDCQNKTCNLPIEFLEQ